MQGPVNVPYRDLHNRLSLNSSRTTTTLSFQPSYANPYEGIRQRNDVTTFLQEWTNWRTHLNRSLIVKAEVSQPIRLKTSNGGGKVFRQAVRAPSMEIDKSLSDFVFQRALNDRFGGGRGYIVMPPETFIAFGIPRPKTTVLRDRTDTPIGFARIDQVPPRVPSGSRSSNTSPVTSLKGDSSAETVEPKPDYDKIARF